MTTKTAVATAEAVINTAYLIEEENSGSSFPALQADIYQPRGLNEKISIGMSEDSFMMLPEESQKTLTVESKTVSFGDDDVLFFALENPRIVVLGMPRLFALNKEDGKVFQLERGMKLAGTGKVTIAKMFVLLLNNDGGFVLNAEGMPQVFTLNLKSSKTQLLNANGKPQPGDGTLASLNLGLRKHYKVSKGWLAHLVSVALVAKPERFTAATGKKESSLGIMFALEGNAKVLPDELQKQSFDVSQDESLKAIMADPFRISGTRSAGVSAAPLGADEADDIEAIPF